MRRSLRRDPDMAFADAGARDVKNVAEPVRAYRVLAEGEPEPKTIQGWGERTRLRPVLIGAVATLAVIIDGIAIWQLTEGFDTADSKDAKALLEELK